MTERMPKIDALLKREIGTIIQHHLADNRLPQLVSVSRVKTTRDISLARVYVTALGGEESVKRAIEVLTDSAKAIRKMLASRNVLPSVPELTFHSDTHLLEARHIEALLDSVATNP